MDQILYVVGVLQQELGIVSPGNEVDLPLTWAERMVGALPVFDSMDAAKEYANDEYEIFTITAEKGE